MPLFVAILLVSSVVYAQNSAVTVNVNVSANRRDMNPNISGVAHADSTTLADLSRLLKREGGNTATRYNWKQSAANHGADWYFESIEESGAAPGKYDNTFIANYQIFL